MPVTRFRAAPRPNSEVVDALEKLLEAARNGTVRSLALVVVNPLSQIETYAVGDLAACRIILIGGLAVAAQELLQKST
jgi:hypothetical protein